MVNAKRPINFEAVEQVAQLSNDEPATYTIVKMMSPFIGRLLCAIGQADGKYEIQSKDNRTFAETLYMLRRMELVTITPAVDIWDLYQATVKITPYGERVLDLIEVFGDAGGYDL